MCTLSVENDTSGTKWKWSPIKIGGVNMPLRCSMPITSAPNNIAYCFGGVFDHEEDEDLLGSFYNDLYALDLEKLVWRSLALTGKKDGDTKAKRRRKIDDEEGIKIK